MRVQDALGWACLRRSAMRDSITAWPPPTLDSDLEKEPAEQLSGSLRVELAELPDGEVAVRSSSTEQLALICPRARSTFILGAKDGELDYLLG